MYFKLFYVILFYGCIVYEIFDTFKLFWVVENLSKMIFGMVFKWFWTIGYELIHKSIHVVEKLLNWFMNQFRTSELIQWIDSDFAKFVHKSIQKLPWEPEEIWIDSWINSLVFKTKNCFKKGFPKV